ncbi:MAG TPA: twin-arginine translocase subunit TatC [Candidatus Limnocylindrales bacterium]|nr:twin-arginine translocase subunit TatC [Candidatus Limnocylindrales bacterium]
MTAGETARGGPQVSSAAGAVMPLVDHLTELRRRIIWSIVAVAVLSIVGYLVSDRVIAFLIAPLPPGTPTKVFGIGDAFAIRLKISIVIGVILAMPILLWHVWRFVAPGLTPNERRTVLPWVPVALLFFVIGVTIAYVILPFASAFLLGFQTDQLQVILDIRSYFDFVTTLFLAFGILMEFPILLVGLSKVGIVTSARLRRARRMVILGIAIFSAVVTPGGDLVSPTVLGVTMYILFEVTTLVIKRQGR